MTTDYPSWQRRAQGNPYGVASIVYRPWGTAYDQSIDDGINIGMRQGQWWYYRQVGKTWRRLSTVNYIGTLKPVDLYNKNMFETSKLILDDLEKRGLKDSSGRPITRCGDDGKRAYVIFVPGPFSSGNMIGFDGTCPEWMPERGGSGDQVNPLWPRPGVTGLSQKGLSIIAGHMVDYANQTVMYDPITKTYKLEWFADEAQEWWGAMMHELGHIFNLPHPPDWSERTIMGAWWEFLGYPGVPFLEREKATLRQSLFFR